MELGCRASQRAVSQRPVSPVCRVVSLVTACVETDFSFSKTARRPELSRGSPADWSAVVVHCPSPKRTRYAWGPAGALSALVVLGALLTARSAAAHCPNLCEASTPSLVIDTPLACAHPSVKVAECDCELRLSLDTIGCAYGLTCDPPLDTCKNIPQGPCDGLAASDFGSLHIPLDSVGETRRRMTIIDEHGSHRVDVAVTVKSFGSGCACDLAARGGASGMAPALLCVAALLVRRRKTT